MSPRHRVTEKSHLFHTNPRSGRDWGSNPGHLRGRQRHKPLSHPLRLGRGSLNAIWLDAKLRLTFQDLQERTKVGRGRRCLLAARKKEKKKNTKTKTSTKFPNFLGQREKRRYITFQLQNMRHSYRMHKKQDIRTDFLRQSASVY
jgi:hypothetical protein